MKSNDRVLSKCLLGTLATAGWLAVAPAAWSACTQDGQVKFAALIDATTGCSSVAGSELDPVTGKPIPQFGCRINNGVGTCTARDGTGAVLFTATASRAANGSTNFSVAPGANGVGADFVATGGASQGNACGYFYQFDAFGGTRLGFEKSNGQYSNVTYVDVCGDTRLETAPPPPPPPRITRNCTPEDPNEIGRVDDTGVICPINTPGKSSSIVCNIELTDANGDPVPFFGLNDTDSCCVCNSAQAGGQLLECDPGLPESEGGCPRSGLLDTEVTTIFEFNNDPYYCYTSGGSRICYFY